MDKIKPNPGRKLFSEINGQKFQRIPIETHFIGFNDKLDEIIKKYAFNQLKDAELLGISCKIVSITTPGLTVHKDTVKITPLAKLITKFVKKWPNDIGYSNPRKMQVAINRAGYLRIYLALFAGMVMKIFGRPGYFYRVAGNQINAIDGFTIGFTKKQIFADYAFLPPRPHEAKQICNKLSKKFNIPVAILDGNNIENNIMGTSDSLDEHYTEIELKKILQGNPQGQEDDGNNTPLVIVKKF